MATLIAEMTISDFKKLKVSELKRLKSCEIYSDGEYLFTFVNGSVDPSGYLRTQTEFRCQTTNGVTGETLEEILGEEVVEEEVFGDEVLKQEAIM